jgi:Paired amphipathic helix repeat
MSAKVPKHSDAKGCTNNATNRNGEMGCGLNLAKKGAKSTKNVGNTAKAGLLQSPSNPLAAASQALLTLSQEASAQRRASFETTTATEAHIARGDPVPYQEHYQVPERTSLVVPLGHPSSRDEEPPGYIDKPTLYDVLCGKGGEVNNHVGNKRYLKLVEANKENYRNACKGSKKQLSQLIVQWVNNGGLFGSTNGADWKVSPRQQKGIQRRPHVGRFIKKSAVNDLWYEIDNHSAWSKVSQAFREGGDNGRSLSSKRRGGDSAEIGEGANSPERDTDEAVTSRQEGDETGEGKKQAELVEDYDLIVPAELSGPPSSECDLIIPREVVNSTGPLAPQSISRHSASDEYRMYRQNQLKQQQTQQSLKLPPPMVPNGGVSMTVAPTPLSAPILALAVVNAFLLLGDGMSRVPTTLCVPRAMADLYANQIVVPMSMISRMELRCPPPSTLISPACGTPAPRHVHSVSVPLSQEATPSEEAVVPSESKKRCNPGDVEVVTRVKKARTSSDEKTMSTGPTIPTSISVSIVTPITSRTPVLLSAASSAGSKDEARHGSPVIISAVQAAAVADRPSINQASGSGGKKSSAAPAETPRVSESSIIESAVDGRDMSVEARIREVPIADALVYLQEVRQAFHDQMDKYEEFITLVKKFRESHSVEAAAKETLFAKVLKLFQGHERLTLGFKDFLHGDDRVHLSQFLAQEKLNEAAFDLATLMNKGVEQYPGQKKNGDSKPGPSPAIISASAI